MWTNTSPRSWMRSLGKELRYKPKLSGMAFRKSSQSPISELSRQTSWSCSLEVPTRTGVSRVRIVISSTWARCWCFSSIIGGIESGSRFQCRKSSHPGPCRDHVRLRALNSTCIPAIHYWQSQITNRRWVLSIFHVILTETCYQASEDWIHPWLSFASLMKRHCPLMITSRAWWLVLTILSCQSIARNWWWGKNWRSLCKKE